MGARNRVVGQLDFTRLEWVASGSRSAISSIDHKYHRPTPPHVRPLDTKPIRFAAMSPNPIRHANLLGPLPQHIRHLLLQIDGNHPALGENVSGE